MNNDSINRDCAQVLGQTPNSFNGEGAIAAVTRVCAPVIKRSNPVPEVLVKPRTPEEMRELAEAVWRQRGLALIDPLLITDDSTRQALINEANRLYGRRAPRAAQVHV